MIDDFIGTQFQTPTGSMLTVNHIIGKQQRRKLYDVSCSICSEDKELYPNGFVASKSDMTRGRIPCGCSKKPQLSEQQYSVIVKRVCKEKNYKFIEFLGGYKNKNTKVVYECPIHGTQNTSSYDNFVNKSNGCRQCAHNTLIESKRNKGYITNVLDICQLENYEFIGYPIGYKNKNSKFDYICRKHNNSFSVSYDSFVNAGCRATCCNSQYGGFKRDKPAIFYVVKWYSESKSWIKFGITNHTENPTIRFEQQKEEHHKKTGFNLTYTPLYITKPTDGETIFQLEISVSKLKQIYGNICSKNEMWDGYTETLPLKAYDEIMKVIKGKW